MGLGGGGAGGGGGAPLCGGSMEVLSPAIALVITCPARRRPSLHVRKDVVYLGEGGTRRGLLLPTVLQDRGHHNETRFRGGKQPGASRCKHGRAVQRCAASGPTLMRLAMDLGQDSGTSGRPPPMMCSFSCPGGVPSKGMSRDTISHRQMPNAYTSTCGHRGAALRTPPLNIHPVQKPLQSSAQLRTFSLNPVPASSSGACPSHINPAAHTRAHKVSSIVGSPSAGTARLPCALDTLAGPPSSAVECAEEVMPLCCCCFQARQLSLVSTHALPHHICRCTGARHPRILRRQPKVTDLRRGLTALSSRA